MRELVDRLSQHSLFDRELPRALRLGIVSSRLSREGQPMDFLHSARSCSWRMVVTKIRHGEEYRIPS
jgi:hypothetical protein